VKFLPRDLAPNILLDKFASIALIYPTCLPHEWNQPLHIPICSV
jgi:hypothetical protein